MTNSTKLEYQNRLARVQDIVDICQDIFDHHQLEFGNQFALMVRNAFSKVQLNYSLPLSAQPNLGLIKMESSILTHREKPFSVRVDKNTWQIADNTKFDNDGNWIAGKISCEPQTLIQLQDVYTRLVVFPKDTWCKYYATSPALVLPKAQTGHFS